MEALSRTGHVRVPGAGETRANRLEGLGALTGLVAGVGIGAPLLGAPALPGGDSVRWRVRRSRQ